MLLLLREKQELAITNVDTFTFTSGNLDYTDADNNDVEGVWQENIAASSTGKGSFSITSEGGWTYSLKPNFRSSLKNSNNDDIWDTFTVYSADGTAQVITFVVERADEVTSTSFDDTDLEFLSPLLADVESRKYPYRYS